MKSLNRKVYEEEPEFRLSANAEALIIIIIGTLAFAPLMMMV